MTIDLFIPILRQLLQVVGGILITRGYLDTGSSEAFIGAAINIITLAWWLFDRSRINASTKKAVVVAETVAETIGTTVKDLPVNKDTIKAVVKSRLAK